MAFYEKMSIIDKKDREILFHLSLHARASLKEIAKKTRVSKEVVHYRIKNLEAKGIIEGYYAVINTYRMGWTFYRVYMKTFNMTADIEQKFIQFLKNNKNVTWVVQMDGDLDFLYVVWAKDISEFQKTYMEINDAFGKYLEQKFFSVMTDVYYFKSKYLLTKESDSFQLTGGKIYYPDLDAEDKQLLTLLSHDCRLSLMDIAKKIKSTAKTVQRRMKKLEHAKIITCYQVKINHKLLGYTQRKIMLNLNDTSTQTMKKLITFLTYHPLTIYITIAIGQYDLEFEMMESSHEDFHKLLKALKKEFGNIIKNYSTVIFYDEPKVGQLALE
ncbi:Lrp/AsnC family transcriptional regulator [Candidatus Woesearchaeota archaeon]|nr:MAG: Lrp/AsnC family transcriptional regulator [Candidatus Woesearchaeota archaeon]